MSETPPLALPAHLTAGALALGVDLGGTTAKIGLVDGTGRVLARGHVGTGPHRPWEQVLDAIARASRLLVEEAGHAVGELDGVGLASAGLLEAESGILRSSPNLPSFHDVPLRGSLADLFARPVAVENDATAFAFGESVAGAARGARNAVFLTLGTGVGGALLVDGMIRRGAHGFAGEIGHMPLGLDGPACACGRRGCVEAYLSTARLLDRAADAGVPVTSVAELAARADAGDAGARDVFAEAGEMLGMAVAGLVNLLDPERVVVGGGVAGTGRPLFGPLEAAVERHVLNRGPRTPIIPVVPAALGADGGVVGAALLALAATAPLEV